MVQPIKIRAVSPTPSAVDQCEQMLQRQVLSGQLKAGERLPGERELAERFGVNRLTLRSALSRLTGRGLLSVRQGRGYAVNQWTSFGTSTLLSNVGDVSEDAVHYAKELLDLRRGLLSSLLSELAGADEACRERCLGILNTFIQDVLSAEGAFRRAEMESLMLRQIVLAANRPVFAIVLNPILDALLSQETLSECMWRDPNSRVDGYRLFIFWLSQPDRDAILPMIMELQRFDGWLLRQYSAPS